MSFPAIDFTQFTFPSDRLTVAALRKVFPHSFDLPGRVSDSSCTPPAYNRASLEGTLGGLIDAERMVASLAFKRVLGLPLTAAEALDSHEGLVEGLACEYVTLGLATGEHHAEELIRDIDSQATSQARSHEGHPR